MGTSNDDNDLSRRSGWEAASDVALFQLDVMRRLIGSEIDEPAMKAFAIAAMTGASLNDPADIPVIVNRAWLGLSPHQREIVRENFGSMLGTLDGLPLRERDSANVTDLIRSIRYERSEQQPLGERWASESQYFSPIRQALLTEGAFIIAPGYTSSYTNGQLFHNGLVIASQDPGAEHVRAIDVRVSRQEARALIASLDRELSTNSARAAVVAQHLDHSDRGSQNSLVGLLAGFRTAVAPYVEITVQSGPEQWIEQAVRDANEAMNKRGLPGISVR